MHFLQDKTIVKKGQRQSSMVDVYKKAVHFYVLNFQLPTFTYTVINGRSGPFNTIFISDSKLPKFQDLKEEKFPKKINESKAV